MYRASKLETRYVSA